MAGRCIKVLLAVFIALMPCAVRAEAPDLDKLAGAYRNYFAVKTAHGGAQTAEDILELVKLSPTSAYVRMRLSFDYGQRCNFWGIANVEDGALTYHGGADDEGRQCILRLEPEGRQMTIIDQDENCRVTTCGPQSRYSGAKFALKTRRAITYMHRLLASKEYAEAVRQHSQN